MPPTSDSLPPASDAAPASPAPPGPAGEESPSLAAVDLGSNSFHMLIARLVDGEPSVIDRIREPVQLAWGLRKDGQIADDAVARALAALERLGQRIRHVPPALVRAVGTNTLRRAKKARTFHRAAEAALGHPIEIVSGREEARLIYLGVAHSLPDDLEPRLVVDIGGGSTEVILGERFEAFEAHSLHMGCISYTKRFFPDGQIRRKAFESAELAARAEVQTIERRFRDFGWGRAVGASGTVRAAAEVLRLNDWGTGTLTASGLKRLRKALVAARDVAGSEFPGLKSRRARVFPGGVAILLAIFDALGIEEMDVSSGALREGVMYDLLGRIRHEDVRERTIRLFQERYQVDLRQAARVERNALAFLRQAAPGWGVDAVEAGRFLTWAARLHEVGLAVAYNHHHRHGAYLVRNSDMPGFSRDDQEFLAAVLAGHRRKVSRLTVAPLPRSRRGLALRLTALLRLAVRTNRERGPHPVPPLRLRGLEDGLEIEYPPEWLERNPLTGLDFASEATQMEKVDFRLVVHPAPT